MKLPKLHKKCHEAFKAGLYESGDTENVSNACKVYDRLIETCPDKDDCIGENFNQLIEKIELEWFQGYTPQTHVDYYFYNYVLLLYLFVERVDLIFEVVNKDGKSKIFNDYHHTKFPVLRRINKWANFIKHPKEFLFTHWPTFYFADDKPEIRSGDVVINYDFIKQHYFNEKQPRPKVLENNDKVYVEMPDLVKMTESFTAELNEFFDFICNNHLVAEFLRKKSTIEQMYDDETDDSVGEIENPDPQNAFLRTLMALFAGKGNRG